MEEKIKIGLPEPLAAVLKKDCRDFGIVKTDGAPNLNAFLGAIVLHYYENFLAAEENFDERLRAALETVDGKMRERVLADVKRVVRGNGESGGERNSAFVAFKPTRATHTAAVYIESVLSPDESLASFYRRLFASYASKTKNEREKIVFRDTYELLCHAMQKGCQVLVHYGKEEAVGRFSVYAVSASRDELFNYLLAYDGKRNVTMRLSSIKSVHLLSERAFVPDENAAYFKRQIACGAQYPIYNTDNEPIRVQLTDKGKKLFEKIYLYRPTPVSVEGDIYTFDCSANQALYYFERFGETALILSPKKLGIFMRNYYYFAYKKYNQTYRHD